MIKLNADNTAIIASTDVMLDMSWERLSEVVIRYSISPIGDVTRQPLRYLSRHLAAGIPMRTRRSPFMLLTAVCATSYCLLTATLYFDIAHIFETIPAED